MTQLDVSDLTPQALFTQYLAVVNRAIAENRSKFPYQQLTTAGSKLLGDRPLDVAVYKTDASSPFDHHTIRFDDGRFEYVEHAKAEGDRSITWKVNKKHLEHVVSDPQTFIEQPAKLDLDWLTTRIKSN